MDGATIGTYLELLRVIKLVLDTNNFGLKIQPTLLRKAGIRSYSAIVTGQETQRQGLA
jgi:hypothetical protein